MMKPDNVEISSLLKRDFNAVTLPQKSLAQIISILANHSPPQEENSQTVFSQPARQFEKQTGLTGIAGRYSLPEGVLPVVLENILKIISMKPEALPLQNELWQRLIELNPELEKVSVQRDDLHSMDNALMGVTSGFNVDDINFFLEGYKTGIPSYTYPQNPCARNLYDEIERRAGTIPWVPAPVTLEKIKSQLDKRPLARNNTPGVS